MGFPHLSATANHNVCRSQFHNRTLCVHHTRGPIMARPNRVESADLTAGTVSAPSATQTATATTPKVGRGAMLSALHRRLEGKKSTRVTVDTENGEYKYAVADMLREHTAAAFREAASVAGIKATEPAGYIETMIDGVVVRQEIREGGTFKGAQAATLANAIFGIA